MGARGRSASEAKRLGESAHAGSDVLVFVIRFHNESEEIAMEYLPDVYQHFERAFPHVHSAHQELAKACYEAGPLDERTARLVKLGIALGAQAEGAVRSHARRALGEGESREEVRHVGLLALTTIGFPHTIAGLGWIEEVIETAK